MYIIVYNQNALQYGVQHGMYYYVYDIFDINFGIPI